MKKGAANPNYRHGHAVAGEETLTYRIWMGMRARCLYPSATGYKNYGGRGIKVCERWSIFENFLADMGECPPGLSLERGENDGDYEPGNCRWASKSEQMNNYSRNVVLEHKGQKLTVMQWSRLLGVSYNCLIKRVRRGWSTEDILSQKARIFNSRGIA